MGGSVQSNLIAVKPVIWRRLKLQTESHDIESFKNLTIPSSNNAGLCYNCAAIPVRECSILRHFTMTNNV